MDTIWSPSMFDMGIYIDNSLNTHYVFAWTDWQLYEFETGSYDYWQDIMHEILTKKYNQDQPWKIKTASYIDLIGYKAQGTNIDVEIFSEDIFQTGWEITDINISYNVWYKTIGSKSLWAESLWGMQQGDDIKIYQYTVRITCYVSWENVSIWMKSQWWTRTLDRLRIWFEWQPIDVFYTNQYL